MPYSLSIVIPDFRMGGAQRVLINFARHLQQRGIQVQWWVWRDVGPMRLSIPKCQPVLALAGAKGFRGALIGPLRCWGLLLKRDTDRILVSVSGVSILIALLSLLSGRRCHLVIREANGLSNYGSAIRRLLARVLFPRMYRFIAVSSGVARDLSRAFAVDPRHIAVVPNPVNIRELSELAESEEDFLLDLKNRAGHRPLLVAVGRLARQKGFDCLLKALSLIPEASRPYLVILGEGPDRLKLDSHVRHLGLSPHVWLAGVTENPYSVILQARLLVLSSRWEGFPNVLLEALALGKPVVATRCPHGPADLIAEGVNGFLVPVDNPTALAVAITRALAHRWEPVEIKSSVNAYAPELIYRSYADILDLQMAVRT
jgi:glycosyltransferase involved in cell wall biosynthesis